MCVLFFREMCECMGFDFCVNGVFHVREILNIFFYAVRAGCENAIFEPKKSVCARRMILS